MCVVRRLWPLTLACLHLFASSSEVRSSPSCTFLSHLESVERSSVQFFGDAEWRKDSELQGDYISITDALSHSRGVVVFPELFDVAIIDLSLSGFVRIGAGAETPGHGFSINVVRPEDPVLISEGIGFVTGQPGDMDAPEEGATTGLSIGFDQVAKGSPGSQGELADCGVDTDCIGISVRVDGKLLAQTSLPTLRGGVDDATSLQTGTDWAPFSISLASHPFSSSASSNSETILSVSYKDTEVFLDSIDYRGGPGRLVVGGRTELERSNQDVMLNRFCINGILTTWHLMDFNRVLSAAVPDLLKAL